VEGEPRQVTVAAGVEVQPSMAVAGDGTARLALATTAGNQEIWALPLDPNRGKVTGELQRITSTVVTNVYPNASRDGSRIVFTSDRQRNHDVFLKDLRTGTETTLTSTDVNEFSPFFSPDGLRVLYYVFRPDRKLAFTFHVVSASGGVSRQVCAEHDGPLYDWSSDGKKVIYRDLPAGRPGRVLVCDVDSGRDDILLEHSKYMVTFPRLSRDERWISFQTVITQSQRRIFVAPVRDWRAPPESGWIPITDGRTPDRFPIWSPDGNLLYFQSDRDGFRCLWGQRLDPTTKRPRGEPFVVQDFHLARRPLSTTEAFSFAPDKAFFNMPENTGNVWMAKLEAQ
jgi:Tol biopolymer transport system component